MNSCLFRKALIIPVNIIVLLYGSSVSPTSESVNKVAASPQISAYSATATTTANGTKVIKDTLKNQFTIETINSNITITGSNYVPQNEELKSIINFNNEYTLVKSKDSIIFSMSLPSFSAKYACKADAPGQVTGVYRLSVDGKQVMDVYLAGEKENICTNPFSVLTDDQVITLVSEFNPYLN